ncbi:hypothetical protein JOF56_002554 [Kibdelosporangium banguiense]|uniref:Uncharacterized protein n=1 Tax=Kibdelosporangium banguiense TaxID=1365924 RepID=A0ABS4TCL6_9PSEU|nr:hypothetical protein [Kibdelosporangium banguiense]MBP2322169.1 hypothetical protein [Kibdelosporangium banguiense]
MYLDDKSTVPAAWNDPARNAMDQMLENMKNFKESAASGQFAISESGGESLIKVIRMLQDWLEGHDTGTLEQKPMLGGSYGAKVMAPFLQEIASDEQGFIPQLARLRDVLADAETGVHQAMANYRRTEHAVAGTYRR